MVKINKIKNSIEGHSQGDRKAANLNFKMTVTLYISKPERSLAQSITETQTDQDYKGLDTDMDDKNIHC